MFLIKHIFQMVTYSTITMEDKTFLNDAPYGTMFTFQLSKYLSVWDHHSQSYLRAKCHVKSANNREIEPHIHTTAFTFWQLFCSPQLSLHFVYRLSMPLTHLSLSVLPCSVSLSPQLQCFLCVYNSNVQYSNAALAYY